MGECRAMYPPQTNKDHTLAKKSKKTFTKGKPTSDRETVPPRHYRPRPRPRHHPHPHPHPPWPSRSRRSRPPPVEAQANVGIRDGARCDDDRCVHRGRPEVRVAVPMRLVQLPPPAARRRFLAESLGDVAAATAKHADENSNMS